MVRKAELEQLAMNDGSAPVDPHRFVAGLPDSGISSARAAEARAMPSHLRLGPDGPHCLHDRREPPIQLQEEQAIAVSELNPTAHLALKHHQLTSERGILSLENMRCWQTPR
jgi:hypothetical protein